MIVFHAMYTVQLSNKYKIYWRRCIGMMPIWLLVWKINMWAIRTTMQHTFPVCQSMLGWWICTHCNHDHIRRCCMYMTPIWNHRFFYMSWTGEYPFHQTFCFVHLDLDIWVSSNNNHAMIVVVNEYFWYICSTHNHTWPFTVHTSS